MTTIMSLTVAVLAGLAARRLVTPLSLAVYWACGGRRTASGTVGRWLALSAGVLAPIGLIPLIWWVLLTDPATWTAPQPYHIVLMMVSLGLSLGYFRDRRRPGTVMWCLRQEGLALAARRAGRRQL